MERFGSDRPDLRYSLELKDVADLAEETEFRVFQQAKEAGYRIRGLCAPGGAQHYSRKDLDGLTEFVGTFGAKGLVWLKVEADAFAGPTAKFFKPEVQAKLRERFDAKAGDLIRLPEGTYHVVSTYGDSNAIQRADVRVETGKITDATLHHRAAKVTLKLVAQAGGEAFAGTAFSVLTPGGDVIREAIGAFPQVILAEGDYVLIARQEGQVYSRDFKVESGIDRDIEVLAK